MSAIVQRKLEQARQRLQNGDLMTAAILCQDVLAQAPRNPEALWLLGTVRLMNGEPADAVTPLEQALAVEPNSGTALDGLGLAYLMLGRYADAEPVLRKAAALPGAPGLVRMRLGMALTHMGRHADAVAELEHVVAQEPSNSDARVNLGLALARAGDEGRATQEFETVLQRSPQHPHAMYNLGVVNLDYERYDIAESWFRKTLSAAPDYTDAMVNLGVTLQRLDRLAEAAAQLQMAAAQQPPQIGALTALAQVLAVQGEHQRARELYTQALKLDPQSLAARDGLAVANIALGRHSEAATHLREIIGVEPQNAGAWNALAAACFQYGALDEAAAAADRALELDASQPDAYSTLAQIHYVRGDLDRAVDILAAGSECTANNHLLAMSMHMLRRICDWLRWRAAWERLRPKIDHASDLGSPYWLLFEDATPEQLLGYVRRWAANRFGPVRDRPGKPPPSERLRVGYLSADFHEHPVARLVVEVLELHDRSRFEVFAYSHGPDDGSELRSRLRNAVEHFVDIAREPDDRAIELMRSHGLHVLIDLHGYTMGDRLEIMAARPAPVQATWWGFQGTTGAEFMDYLIADEHIIPTGTEHYYSERVLRMPHCYMPNDRQRRIDEPLPRSEYGLPRDAIVFCCFNQTVKYTPAIFGRWMSLLRTVPGSVLWLLEDNRWATESLRRTAQDHGVQPNRIVFASRLPSAQHLARYRAADIALDTFPYGSHTTGNDALWSGCPLVTLRGSTFVSRVAASLLMNCGLPELVTDTLEGYEAAASKLATDLTYRNDIRARLARARDQAPLFDSQRFVRDLEQLYLRIA